MADGIYLLKANNRNTRTRGEICSKLTKKNIEQVIAGWEAFITRLMIDITASETFFS